MLAGRNLHSEGQSLFYRPLPDSVHLTASSAGAVHLRCGDASSQTSMMPVTMAVMMVTMMR